MRDGVTPWCCARLVPAEQRPRQVMFSIPVQKGNYLQVVFSVMLEIVLISNKHPSIYIQQVVRLLLLRWRSGGIFRGDRRSRADAVQQPHQPMKTPPPATVSTRLKTAARRDDPSMRPSRPVSPDAGCGGAPGVHVFRPRVRLRHRKAGRGRSRTVAAASSDQTTQLTLAVRDPLFPVASPAAIYVARRRRTMNG